MREILFRGKRESTQWEKDMGYLKGIWVYGYLLQRFNGGYVMFEEHSMEVYEVIPETVGQFTGLTDKNGTKIFEGDIVTSFANVFKSVVEWNNLGFAPFSNDRTSFFADECEVIGNIHEKGETNE